MTSTKPIKSVDADDFFSSPKHSFECYSTCCSDCHIGDGCDGDIICVEHLKTEDYYGNVTECETKQYSLCCEKSYEDFESKIYCDCERCNGGYPRSQVIYVKRVPITYEILKTFISQWKEYHSDLDWEQLREAFGLEP